LNLLLVALFLLVTERGLHPFAQGVVWGVALTTHITALMLFLLFRPRQNSRSQIGAQLLTFFLGSVVGLLPYVLLPLWRQPTSPVQWGTLDTVSGWWWLVTAQLYRPNAFALTPEWWLPRFMEWSDPLLTALTPLMWPLIILSLWFTGRQSSEKNHSSPAGEGGVRLLLLITTALFYLLFAFFYLPADALVLTGPAWLLLAYALVTVLQRWPNLALILPLGLLLINYPLLNSRENNNLLTEVDNALVDVPEGALLTTAGSPEIFTLWYFQHVEGQRNDLMLVDYQLFAFSWYRDRLKNQYPELSIPAADDWAQFQRDNQRRHPICTISITFPDMKEYVTATSCEDR